MSRAKVLAEVERRLSRFRGVRALQFLDEESRAELARLEREVEGRGAAGGLMPFVNEGMSAVLNRDQLVAIVLFKAALIFSSDNLLQIKDDRGNILGEWVNRSKASKLESDPKVHFLSKDFVLYRMVSSSSRPFFVVPKSEFPYLFDIKGIRNVASASPSVPGDTFIKNQLKVERTDLPSRLIGFDFSENGFGTASIRSQESNLG